MNAVILLSDGVGSRLHSDVPKQYISVGGRMRISYALAMYDGVRLVFLRKDILYLRKDGKTVLELLNKKLLL